MAESQAPLVLDTPAFFVGKARLKTLFSAHPSLATFDLVCFEFLKVVHDEIHQASVSGSERRVQLLQTLRDRFPELLQSLEVQVTAATFTVADIEATYALLAERNVDPGDAMIWLKMRKQGWRRIATADVEDYRRLGAEVTPL